MTQLLNFSGYLLPPIFEARLIISNYYVTGPQPAIVSSGLEEFLSFTTTRLVDILAQKHWKTVSPLAGWLVVTARPVSFNLSKISYKR